MSWPTLSACLRRRRRGDRGAGHGLARPHPRHPDDLGQPGGHVGAARLLGQFAHLPARRHAGAAPADRRDLGDALLLAILVRRRWWRAPSCFTACCRCELSRMAARVSNSYKLVILWGGLRGAVSLALALAMSENAGLPAMSAISSPCSPPASCCSRCWSTARPCSRCCACCISIGCRRSTAPYAIGPSCCRSTPSGAYRGGGGVRPHRAGGDGAHLRGLRAAHIATRAARPPPT